MAEWGWLCRRRQSSAGRPAADCTPVPRPCCGNSQPGRALDGVHGSDCFVWTGGSSSHALQLCSVNTWQQLLAESTQEREISMQALSWPADACDGLASSLVYNTTQENIRAGQKEAIKVLAR